MSDPVGDPNLKVDMAEGPGGGRLVMTDEAVQGWVAAYRKYANEMIDIAKQVEERDRVTNFGDLDSLRQLAAGYDQLMYGGENSLHQRVLEFAAAASRFADKLQQDWLAILAEDDQTKRSMFAIETPR